MSEKGMVLGEKRDNRNGV